MNFVFFILLDEADRVEDPEGELAGALHEQGRYEEASLLAPRLQVHHHVRRRHRHQVLQGYTLYVSLQ